MPRLSPALALALGLLAACRPAERQGAASSATPAPSAPPSASLATPSASAPPPPARPTPTSLRATTMLAGRGRQATLTLLQTEPGAGAVLLNEETGDFFVFEATDEGGTLKLTSASLSLSLTLPVGRKEGSLLLPGLPAISLSLPKEEIHAKIGAYGRPASEERVFLSPSGERIVIPPEKRPEHLFHEESRWNHRKALLYQGGRWLLAEPFPPSLPLRPGGQRIAPEPLTPGSTLGCLVHGEAPSIEGPRATPLRQAWQSWVRDRCSAAGPGALLGLSYTTVPLGGVNLPECDLEPQGAPRGPCTSPTSSQHLPINLRARVSGEAGGYMVEEALLLDTRSDDIPRLTDLAQPGFATVLGEWVNGELASVAGWVPRKAITWPPPAPQPGQPPTTLAVGPTTIDVVLPPAPLGLFVASRHLAIGPRSRFVTAFTPGPATRRLTAALLVDYLASRATRQAGATDGPRSPDAPGSGATLLPRAKDSVYIQKKCHLTSHGAPAWRSPWWSPSPAWRAPRRRRPRQAPRRPRRPGSGRGCWSSPPARTSCCERCWADATRSPAAASPGPASIAIRCGPPTTAPGARKQS